MPALKRSCLSQPFLASDPKAHRNMKETSATWLGATAPAREAWQGAGSAESAGWEGKSWQLNRVGLSPGSLDSDIAGYKRQRTQALSVGERTEPSERASLVGTDSTLGVAVGESGADETASCLSQCHALLL